jgi:hypothetical protein
MSVLCGNVERSIISFPTGAFPWIGPALQKKLQHARMIVQGGVVERRAGE